MRAQVAAAAPLEACGLIGGRQGISMSIFPIDNEEASSVYFRMNPHQQVQAMMAIAEAGLDLLAVYHSHPAGPTTPSKTDLDELSYLEIPQLIWSLDNHEWICMPFLLEGSKFKPLKFRLSNSP